VSQRLKSFLGSGLQRPSHPIKARIGKRSHSTGGTPSPGLSVATIDDLEAAFVTMVSVVATTLGPGTTFAGAIDAVVLLGKPELLNDTEESNEPPFGVT
jgi:hypothetical protein